MWLLGCHCRSRGEVVGKMIERRHEIIKQLISEWEQCEDMLDVQNLFVVALSLVSECIGYIDAIKGGEGERRENEGD